MKTLWRAGNSRAAEEEEESRMAASEMANDTFYIPRGKTRVNEACLLREDREKFSYQRQERGSKSEADIKSPMYLLLLTS